LERLFDKVVEGKATMDEVDQVHEIASNITGNTICAFGDGAAQPALAFIRKYRKSFEDYVENQGRSQTGKLTL
jgi:NADH-quinone oxidoreductase subunit F